MYSENYTFAGNQCNVLTMTAIKVTAAIIIKGNRIFIAQRNQEDELAGKWEFPGGKIEAYESPQKCLKRELFEEFGIDTEVKEYLGESIFDYGNKLIHLSGYFVNHLSGDINLQVHQNYKWIKVQELDKIDWAPADVKLVELLKKKLTSQ